mgnify:CR=1 FL=1
MDTQSQSEEAEDARDGAQAAAGHEKQLQGSEDQVPLGLHGKTLALGLKLAQASLGLFERFGGALSCQNTPPRTTGDHSVR